MTRKISLTLLVVLAVLISAFLPDFRVVSWLLALLILLVIWTSRQI